MFLLVFVFGVCGFVDECVLILFVLFVFYVIWGLIYFGICYVLESYLLFLFVGVCFFGVGVLFYGFLCLCGMVVLIVW